MIVTALYFLLMISCISLCVYTFVTKAIHESLPLKIIITLFIVMALAMASSLLFVARVTGQI